MDGAMREIAAIPARACRDFAALLCDLDDTLTAAGKLVPGAYAAMWRARDAGLPVVVVTGRPAGWADHMARMWPVHGVIGENGGLYFRHAGGRMRRVYAASPEQRAEWRARLDGIAAEVLRAVPGCAVAADQPYRELDLAVDYAEDVEPLPLEAARRIEAAFRARGARAKVSSIHVNGWFGDFDKLTTAKRYLREELGIDPEGERERVLFVGDSPNDEPMFSFFPRSAGVATVRRFAALLGTFPAYVTRAGGGEGFAELVDAVLARRRGGH
jgi:HAD superfamily hydrolase (TIGR01484 family)